MPARFFLLRAAFGACALLFAATATDAQISDAPAMPQAATAPQPKVMPPGRVSVDTSKGYARLLFSYSAPSSVSASIVSNVLTIRLAQGIDSSPDTLTHALTNYVTSGRADADGKTLRFALANAAALHSSTVGGQTAIDLVPDSFAGTPPDLPLPPPPEKTAPDLTKLTPLKAEVSEYSNYTRVSFAWPKTVLYTIFPGRGRVTLRFEALARIDFAAITERAPAWVKNAGWHVEDKATIVEIETDPDASFRDFHKGNEIGVEILAPKTDAEALNAPALPATKPPASLMPAPAGTDARAIAKGVGDTATDDTAHDSATPSTPDTGAVASASEAAPPRAELSHDDVILKFPAARGHGAAVFGRGPTIWIVLDGHPPIDPATLLSGMSSVIGNASAEETDGAAILKISFKTAYLPQVTEDDTALVVTLSPSTRQAPMPVSFARGGANGQTDIEAHLVGASRVVHLTDTDAGDTIYAVTGRVGHGVLTPQRFVEFSALPTAAGVAILPSSDDLRVSASADMVTIRRPLGLAVSAEGGLSPEPVVQIQKTGVSPAFIDFARWGGGNSDVYQAERDFRSEAARLPEAEANKARLRFAQYLLSHELAAETLGVIGLMTQNDPDLKNNPQIAAMTGAAQTMMARYADARTTLSAAGLEDDPHAALWRGMAEANLADWAKARHDLAMANTVLASYPEQWRTRARLAMARAGIATGDMTATLAALNALDQNLSPRDLQEAKIYDARLQAAQGHTNEAIKQLMGVEQSNDPFLAASATYARVDLQLAAKKTKISDAIETLEKLRYRWRGDDLELQTLRKLGSLYFAQSDWRNGMAVLRIAATNFANTDLGRQSQDDMRAAFVDLFLNGKADAMKPVDAVALYYDFLELTPIGADGDEMIRRLADRLVSVDLLTPAETLLQHQVDNRLEGVAKAEVATKLALVYLMDHKPDDALRAIRDTRQTRLPDDLNTQRRLLEARALSDGKHYEEALDVLADDDTPSVKALRADVYWDAAQWPTAGAKIEDLLGDSWQQSAALSDVDRSRVLRAAIAYSLANDQASLDRLSSHYADKMKSSPDAQGFALVTAPIERQGVAFRDLANQIAGIDTLKSFMAEFRKQQHAENPVATRTASN